MRPARRSTRAAVAAGVIGVALTAGACGSYGSTSGPDHCGAVVGDEIWGRDLNPHDISCSVTIQGNLTIGPGTRVRFAPGTELIVNGDLSIEGDAERPVRFESSDDGLGYVGIRVGPVNTGNFDQSARPSPYVEAGVFPPTTLYGSVSIDHLEISGAGVPPEVPANFSPGAIVVQRGPVDLTNVTIDGSRGCGLTLTQDASLGVETSDLTITGTADSAICADAGAVSSLPVEGITLDEGSVIEVVGETLTGRHTWRDIGATYRLTDDLVVQRGELTIDAGVDLRIDSGIDITVGNSVPSIEYGQGPRDSGTGEAGPGLTRDESATLRLLGTSSAPVTVDVQDVDGSRWGRIFVDGDAAGGSAASIVAQNVEIANGGGGTDGEPANLHLAGDATATLTDVSLSGSGGAGLLLEDEAVLVDSSNVSISGNAYPVVTTADGALSLPAEGSDYSGNNGQARDGARAVGNVIYLTGTTAVFDDSGVLKNLGVPYRLDGDLETSGGVNATGDGNKRLEIEPGVRIEAPEQAEVELGTNAALDLVIGADGGAAVTFAGVPGAAGPWGFLNLGPSLSEANSAVHNLRVEGAGFYSGPTGLEGSTGSLRIGASGVPIQGVTVDGSASDPDVPGVRLSGAFGEASSGLVVINANGPAVWSSADSVWSIPADGVDLTANGEFNYVVIDGIRVGIGGTWSNLGVPYRVDDLLTISGREDAEGVPLAARVEIEAGVELEFEPNAGLRTNRYESTSGATVNGAVAMDGTASDPIILRAVDPVDGWSNLHLFYEDDMSSVGDRSRLSHVQILDAGAIFAQASFEMWDSTPTLSDITIDEGFRYGVGLQGDSFVGERDSETGIGCNEFDRSVYTFGTLVKSVDEPREDTELLDFRVFITDEGSACL